MTTTATIISIPVANADGMDSHVSGHYARSPMHAIVNTGDGSVTFIGSGKARIPFAEFRERNVHLVICRQMGRHACETLAAQGIEILVTKGANIREAVMEYDSGKLEKPTAAMLDHEGVMKHKHGEKEGECGHHGEGRCCEGHDHGETHGNGQGHGCCHRHGQGHACCHNHE
jgi:predicted Fe-Mo cluster-binding NifX family protein